MIDFTVIPNATVIHLGSEINLVEVYRDITNDAESRPITNE